LRDPLLGVVGICSSRSETMTHRHLGNTTDSHLKTSVKGIGGESSCVTEVGEDKGWVMVQKSPTDTQATGEGPKSVQNVPRVCQSGGDIRDENGECTEPKT
jgi:hypothetical protein